MGGRDGGREGGNGGRERWMKLRNTKKPIQQQFCYRKDSECVYDRLRDPYKRTSSDIIIIEMVG